ncbi:acylneuraminate cytidylyltransferase family protein [Betaproteobacteria bacterium LSUCC0117]|nr:acylneuraminate cytidylyltransferase family protein [Betaproteobacteria bacterium LSUCC0117]
MTARIAFTFARGGSKGLPNKNILKLDGIPLIARAVTQALETGLFEHVVVSTDSEEIASIAEAYGAYVPFLRPSELAQDQSIEWLSWRHAVQFMKCSGYDFRTFASIPTTSPLRRVDDIRRTVEKYETEDFDVVTCVTESNRNPYFNMVEMQEDRSFKRVIDTKYSNRQLIPKTYDMCTIATVTSSEYIENNNSIFDGRLGCNVVDRERSLDIDDAFDFKLAQILYKNEK